MRIDPFHVGIAAEAFAAGMFAQAGCDVLVQYGANQPDYDFMARRGDGSVMVSVKGSQDGGWGLIQNYKSKQAGYHEAADAWAADQSPSILDCLVQFQGIVISECPRVYLASVADIARRHRESRNGLGTTVLYEHYVYKKGIAAGWTDQVPTSWRFSLERLGQFLPVV